VGALVELAALMGLALATAPKDDWSVELRLALVERMRPDDHLQFPMVLLVLLMRFAFEMDMGYRIHALLETFLLSPARCISLLFVAICISVMSLYL
jgi:hypothetical protein